MTPETSALRKRFADTIKEISSVSSHVDKRIKLVEEKEAAWEALNLRMQENARTASDKITLNVGGGIFATAKANLLRFEGSYFHAMLASGHWKPDSDGAYFIDLSPKHFNRVLDYLRSGELSFDGLRPDQVQQLRKALDYLLLNPEIEEPLQWDPQYCGTAMTLSGENRVATNVASSWHAVHSTAPCTRFTVRLTRGSDVMIGFAPRAGVTPSGASFSSCGWFLYANGGGLYAQGSFLGRAYSTKVAVGSKVTAVLDRQSNSISFEENGKSLGVAYPNIPAEDMYATVQLYSSSVALEDESA